MFTKLKRKLLNYSISVKKRSRTANKRFHSFDTARNIGVLFCLDNSSLPKDVQDFLTYLKQKRLFYFALGYYDRNENPTNFIATNRIAIFNKTDMNWYNKPTSVHVTSFLERSYDIVIDLCRENVAPLQYVSACVDAATLVGGHFYEGCHYDLIVDAQKTCNTTEYIEQVKRYLAIITYPNKEKP